MALARDDEENSVSDVVVLAVPTNESPGWAMGGADWRPGSASVVDWLRSAARREKGDSRRLEEEAATNDVMDVQ